MNTSISQASQMAAVSYTKETAVEKSNKMDVKHGRDAQITTESWLWILANLLGFGLLPDLPPVDMHVMPYGSKTFQILTPNQCKKMYLRLRKTKLHLIEKADLKEKAATLLQQNIQFPIMQRAVSALQRAFCELDDLYYDGCINAFNHKKQKIKKQLCNTAVLVDLLAEIGADEKNKSTLFNLATFDSKYTKTTDKEIKWALEINPNSHLVADSLLNGLAAFTSTNLPKIKQDLLKKIQTILHLAKKQAVPAALTHPKIVITHRALFQQSELHRAMREGKAWAARQTVLTPRKTHSPTGGGNQPRLRARKISFF